MRGFLPAKWKDAGGFEIGSGSSVGYAELGCGSGMVSYPFYAHVLIGMKAGNVPEGSIPKNCSVAWVFYL